MGNLKLLFQYYSLVIQVIFWRLAAPILTKIPSQRLKMYCLFKVITIGLKLFEIVVKKDAYKRSHLSA